MIRRFESFSGEELSLILTEEPLIAFYFLRSKVIEDSDFNFPAGVSIKNGQIHLYLNPDIMNTFSISEKAGVLVHEYLHVLLLHVLVRNSNEEEKRKKENIAMDMAINQLIRRSPYINLPDGVVYHNGKFTTFISGKPEVVQFDFPADLTAENYFELLDRKYTDEDFEAMGISTLDDHSEWDESSELEGRSVVKSLAEDFAKRHGGDEDKIGHVLAGSKYGDILERLLAIETDDIPWQTKVKRFLHQHVDFKRKFSYKRFSRRHGFPNPGRKYKNKAKVAVIVDTSGSMSNSFLSHIGGQLNLMSKIMQVDIFWCDAQVQGEVKKYKPSAEIAFPGRGGTNMQPGFDAAMEQGYRGVVCFTDGYLFQEPECKLPTIWVIVNNPNFNAPFGEVTNVDWRE